MICHPLAYRAIWDSFWQVQLEKEPPVNDLYPSSIYQSMYLDRVLHSRSHNRVGQDNDGSRKRCTDSGICLWFVLQAGPKMMILVMR